MPYLFFIAFLEFKKGYLWRYALIYGQEELAQKNRPCAWQEEFNLI
jgi:hypothetical protein